MLRDYVQKTQDEISRLRVADYLRTSRDRVLDSGLVHFWFKKWVVAALAAIAVLLVGVALLISSGIDFDTFLNYFALGLLVFVLITLFYGIIAIHDVPYEIAKHRNHPQAEAIHVAGWLSLFTLHAIWPFVFIWAFLGQGPLKAGGADDASRDPDVRRRLGELEEKLRQLEKQLNEPLPKSGKS